MLKCFEAWHQYESIEKEQRAARQRIAQRTRDEMCLSEQEQRLPVDPDVADRAREAAVPIRAIVRPPEWPVPEELEFE